MKRFALPSIALLLTACVGVPQPQQPAPFASSLSVGAVTIGRGGNVNVQITSNRAALYTISGLPEGVTAERGSSNFTLYNVSAQDDTAQVTVTVTPEGGGSPVQLPLTVITTGAPVAAPAPTLSLSTVAVTLAQGASTTVEFASNGTVTTGTLPGLTVTQSGNNLVLRNDALAAGTHTLPVTASLDGQTVSANITVTVPGTAPTPLTLSVSPTFMNLEVGQQQTFTVSGNLSATLSATASVAGLQLTQNGNTFTVRNVSAAAGVHSVTVFGTGPQGQTAQASVTVTVTGPPVPPPANFEASVSPASLTLAAGASSTVTVSGNAAFTYTVGSVQGLTVTRSGNSFTVTNVSAAPGGYSLPVVATGADGQTRAMTVSVTVPQPAPTPLTLSATPSALTLAQGAEGTVTLSSNLPATLSAVSSNPGLQLTQSGATYTVRNVSAPAGTHTVTVTGTGPQGQTASTVITVTVPQPTPQPVPAPTIGVSPSRVTLAAGASQTVTVTSSTGEFTVQAPQGLTATRSGNTLTLRNDSLAPGQHTVTVTTQNAGGTATATVTVTVPQPAPAFTVSVSPTSFTLNRGASQTVTITANQGYTATVTNIPSGLTSTNVDGGFRFTNTSTADGTYTLNLRVTSTGGEVRNFSLTVTTTGGAPTVKDPSTPVVAPSAFENEVLALVNELRTQGTLQGDASLRAGTCAANWSPLQPLAYHGALHFIANNHAMYLEEEISVHGGSISHSQSNPSNSHFYGSTLGTRAERVSREHGYQNVAWLENIALTNNNATAAVRSWLNSPSHCMNVMNPQAQWGGAGHQGSRNNESRAIWLFVSGYSS